MPMALHAVAQLLDRAVDATPSTPLTTPPSAYHATDDSVSGMTDRHKCVTGAVRASCEFCRKRKIRCLPPPPERAPSRARQDDEPGGSRPSCQACTERGLSCLFLTIQSMGRPRKDAQAVKAPAAPALRHHAKRKADPAWAPRPSREASKRARVTSKSGPASAARPPASTHTGSSSSESDELERIHPTVPSRPDTPTDHLRHPSGSSSGLVYGADSRIAQWSRGVASAQRLPGPSTASWQRELGVLEAREQRHRYVAMPRYQLQFQAGKGLVGTGNLIPSGRPATLASPARAYEESATRFSPYSPAAHLPILSPNSLASPPSTAPGLASSDDTTSETSAEPDLPVDALAEQCQTSARPDLQANVSRLRQVQRLNGVWEAFSSDTIGTMTETFFGLVTGGHTSVARANGQETSNATRALYAAALSAQSNRRKLGKGSASEIAVFSRAMMTSRLWPLISVDLVSLVTTGTTSPSAYAPPDLVGKSSNIPLFVRMWYNDSSAPFDQAGSATATPEPSNPLLKISSEEIRTIFSRWHDKFALNLCLNDTSFLSDLEEGICDPALVCVIVGTAISRIIPGNHYDCLGQRTPADSHSCANLHALPDSSSFFKYAEWLLFGRAGSGKVHQVSTIQALIIWGGHEISNTRPKRAWALFGTAHALVRAILPGRLASRSSQPQHSVAEPTRADVESETLISACWSISLLAAWTFLCLRMPCDSLAELAQGLPLPPASPSESRSWRYRMRPSSKRLASCDDSITKSMAVFSDACRTLQTIVSSMSKPERSAHGQEQQSTLTLPCSTFSQATMADPRLSHLAVFNSAVASYMIDTATSLIGTAPSAQHLPTDLLAGQSRRTNPFLATVLATLALHRIVPFNQKQSQLNLPIVAVQCALRAIEILNEASARPLAALHHDIAKDSDGLDDLRLQPNNEHLGVLRIVSDALPQCLKLMDNLAATPDASEVLSLLTDEEARIMRLLDNLTAFVRHAMNPAAVRHLGELQLSAVSLQYLRRAAIGSPMQSPLELPEGMRSETDQVLYELLDSFINRSREGTLTPTRSNTPFDLELV
ncbi:uncharacterized protein L969DRAFT_94817 [Mixia osmundae IAM 14324]|uniref:Zn(2)-C6 fungal-type domain-containing protein n=1 Tax=Mixia osmundae (strain CBS 9802 / IAM 14324 / JCM 22182 / KY 12970) TaxID=764103 RepID=G7DYW6_MIXOS|nr:uncharacterized protein L969DRAFT_94817 [Mixia osmundae IAM 14324]KEI38607.1 hypothetical protein L969DRAFT_94817 [Mixia osmundae IAM 14324]GAA95776.1 hypothetical protein E5Q_02433 [Mixia osmundae IAM 14324]